MKKKDIWVVVPAYNEGRHISKVLDEISPYCKNIIVVDDGSKDRTLEIAEEKGAVVLQHSINLGKGAALKTGCDYAVGIGAKIIIVMDADGQHKAEDIPRFLDALEGKDIVFGSRKISKKMPSVLRFGNSAINKLSKYLFKVDVKDTQSGFRAFTSNAYKKIRWGSTDYGIESEMIANVGKYNLKYGEIMIDTIYHDKYKGTTVIDGIEIVIKMLWWKINGW